MAKKIRTTIYPENGQPVDRLDGSESCTVVVVSQDGGQLMVRLLVNANGAITLSANENNTGGNVTLWAGRVLADRGQAGGVDVARVDQAIAAPTAPPAEEEEAADSAGSLGYAGGFEYFARGGIVYRAPYENPIDTKGYRQGARFECHGTLPAHLAAKLHDRDGEPVAAPLAEEGSDASAAIAARHWEDTPDPYQLAGGPWDVTRHVPRHE